MEEKTNKNLVDHLLSGIIVVNLLLYFIFLIFDIFNITTYINVGVFIIITGIAIPANYYRKKGMLIHWKAILSLILRSILVTTLMVSMQLIFLSENYELHYTYGMFFVSAVIYINMLLIDAYLINRKDKSIRALILALFLILFLNGFYGLMAYQKLIHPPNRIEIGQVNIPEVIYIIASQNSSYDIPDLSNKITDPKDIELLMKDLENIQVKTFTITQELNYERRKERFPYHSLFFNLNNLDNRSDLFMGTLQINSNDQVVLRRTVSDTGLFGMKRVYAELYPVELSEETLEMLMKYMK